MSASIWAVYRPLSARFSSPCKISDGANKVQEHEREPKPLASLDLTGFPPDQIRKSRSEQAELKERRAYHRRLVDWGQFIPSEFCH